MAALLLIAGTITTLIFEDHHTLSGASLGERFS